MPTQVDQDALAAEWGMALEAESTGAPSPGDAAAAAAMAGQEGGNEAMAAQWAAMIDDGSQFAGAKGGAERTLNQDEIDGLLGFSLADIALSDRSGIRA